MENQNNFSQNVKIDFNKTQEDDELEILKLKKENVHVFKLSSMSSSEGYTTTDFVDLIFKGLIKMTLKGEYMIIYFLNQDNSIFLVSIMDQNIERFMLEVRDSCRYFAIKAMNASGFPSWYGIGISFFYLIAFKQRNDSFDFKTTLYEFREKLQFEKNLKTKGEYKSKYDFSLKTDTKPQESTKKDFSK